VTAAILVLAAVALVAPVPSYAGLRLRALPPGPGGDPAVPAAAWPAGDRPVLVAALGAGAAGGLGALAAATPGDPQALAVPAVAAASMGAVAGWLVSTAIAAQRERRLHDSLVHAVAAVSADLRAGQSEATALRAAAGRAEPELGTVLQGAGEVAAVAGDVAGTLRESAGTLALPSPARSGVLRAAAAWAVSRDCGAPIAAVLDRVAEDLRADRRRSQQIAAQLSGPRATAVLLSLLPALGLVLGATMGAHPMRVLLGTPPGQLALLAGVCLDAAGVLWTVRIVRAAGRTV
jgi:tight adherence protein B